MTVETTQNTVTVTIDGFEIKVPKGTLVIRAAELLGIQIPRFCDHPLLDPIGACRQCLVDVEVQGRHRFYHLATPEVAAALEGLAVLSSGVDSRLRRSRSLDEIAFARSCYDHLAGSLAVQFTSYLLRFRVLRENSSDFLITRTGAKFLASIGIDLSELQRQRRALARRCLDWTERRPHVAGALGAAMLSRFKALGWLIAIRNSRALRVTVEGQRHFQRLFAISRWEPGPH